MVEVATLGGAVYEFTPDLKQVARNGGDREWLRYAPEIELGFSIIMYYADGRVLVTEKVSEIIPSGVDNSTWDDVESYVESF